MPGQLRLPRVPRPGIGPRRGRSPDPPVPPTATATPVPTPSPTFTPVSTPTLTWLPTHTSTPTLTPTPSVTRSGTYDNLAEHPNGTFHLRREGNAVYATFQTDRSPVRFLARDQPDVLFTVPEGFRPVLPITWEVSAEPVLADGTPLPDQPARRVFRMRVDTAGQVRYVDDAGVDGVGHLGYDTALAWPLAGTEPRLCDRHRNSLYGILAAIRALDDVRMPCSLVDWEHLARIRTLSLDTGTEGVARHDLAGPDQPRRIADAVHTQNHLPQRPAGPHAPPADTAAKDE